MNRAGIALIVLIVLGTIFFAIVNRRASRRFADFEDCVKHQAELDYVCQ